MTAITAIRETSNTIFVQAGTVLFEAGDPGDALYIVQAGRLDVLINGTCVATVGPGGVVGEMALISKQPRSATVIAGADSVLAPIDVATFDRLVQQMPAFANEIMTILIERLRGADSRASIQPRPAHIWIRQAMLDDLPAIIDLTNQAISVLSAQNYSPQQIGAALSELVGGDTQSLISDETYFVAESEGQIVGCGGWSRRQAIHPHDHNPGETAFLDPASEPAKIRAFYVHPQWARRGIATRLLTVAEQSARRAGYKRLELLATLTGEPVYLAFGFTRLEQIDLQLRDGTVLPTIRMTKPIAPE